MKSPNFSFEKKLWTKGFKYIAGADEVGRGSFAGPIVAAAVAFNPNILHTIYDIHNDVRIDDSKKLTPKQREIAEKWVKENALAWGIGEASPTLINRIGIGKATKMAFREAVASASLKCEVGSAKLDNEMRSERSIKSHITHRNHHSHFAPRTSIDYLLIDAFFIPRLKGFPKGRAKIKGSINPKYKDGARQLAIINGDEKSISIAAASIIAKVYRDSLMVKLSERSKYKKYGWERNKGYGTSEHREAIVKYGITRYHRKQFVSTFTRKAHRIKLDYDWKEQENRNKKQIGSIITW